MFFVNKGYFPLFKAVPETREDFEYGFFVTSSLLPQRKLIKNKLY